jgi:heparin/heparan-sulfate lyase
MYFDTMGQLYMRSGLGDTDTYVVFVCGGKQENHKHYDNNHFTIYKNGYRAVDSGTRPEPGQHLFQYYCRTVAHNCVTVRMPGETLPKYWGELAAGETAQPVPNDGGQNDQLACTLRYHKETADYVYLASDATKAYNSSKTSNVMREFVYLFPDLFVVLDRVNSSKAEYQKTWLYHTVDEPQIDGLTFTETSQGGRTICRTLYPADAVMEKIGGPGKQFWSDGKNWPLPAELPSNCPPENWPLL